MSADIRPHVYKPLPTPKAHCAKCLGTVRNDFCKARERLIEMVCGNCGKSFSGKSAIDHFANAMTNAGVCA